VVARLRLDPEQAERNWLIELANKLRSAEGSRTTLIGRSSNEIISATWLNSPEDLEVFAAVPAHLRFILEGIGRTSIEMWGSSLHVPASEPITEDTVRDIWAFALPSNPSAFEWEVRELLTKIDTLPGKVAAGQTSEERASIRAGGIVCIPKNDCSNFEMELNTACSDCSVLATRIKYACAPIVTLL
jgi:hypothetical protein